MDEFANKDSQSSYIAGGPPPKRSVVARLTKGVPPWAQRTELRTTPQTSDRPEAVDISAKHTVSRPSPQPYAHTGIVFSHDATPDLRTRLRELVRMSAQVIHTGFVRSAEDHENRALIEANEPEMEIFDQVKPLVEQLHAEARAQLMDAYLDANGQLLTDRVFRSLTDVLSALHAAETAIIALRLLRNHNDAAATVVNANGEEIVHELARRADIVARLTAQALSRSVDPRAAIDAAMAIRGVRALFEQGDHALRKPRDVNSSPIMIFGQIEYRRRICRAALWSVMLCGEHMARVAARFAMTVDEQITPAPKNNMAFAPKPVYPPASPLNPYDSFQRAR